MKWLVIGSNSFSGSSFINFLLNKNITNIYAVSRSDENIKELLAYKNSPKAKFVNFFQFDINRDSQRIADLIIDYKIEYIVNFAAQGMVSPSWKYPSDWFNTNVMGLLKLIEKIYSFKSIKKFIQISTPEVYGSCVDKKEDMSFYPTSPYAASKASADLLLYSYYKTHGFPLNITRSSNVYGPYQQLYRIIPKTILSIKKGEKLNLEGGGKAKRNFIFIDDLSEAIYKIAINSKIGEIYHISGDEIFTIYKIVEMIAKKLNVKMEDFVKVTKDRISQDGIYFLDNSKIKDRLNFRLKYTLDNGIDEVIKWIEKDFNILKELPDYYIHKGT